MKKTLLLFLLLPFFGLAQGLSGDYIISKTNTLAKFETLTSAITKLEQVGFDGPVRFLLDEDQTVTSQYVIKEYTKSSATNTLTIKPNTGKNITITVKKPNDYTGIAAVFLFNGASNVIIDGSNSTANTRNLTLINDDNLGYIYRSIIWIASNGTKGSNNITVKNSTFKFSNRNSGVNLLSGVYSGSNTIGGDNTISVQANSGSNSNITISNNEMINTKEGIYINGNSNATLSPSSWKIQGNKIGSSTTEEKPIRGMYLSNTLNYEISNNIISGIRNTLNQGNDCAAIQLLGTSTGTIASNTIDNISNEVSNNSYLTAGILIQSSGTTNIYNNIISNVYNIAPQEKDENYHNVGHNIYITSGSATNIYFNTISVSGAPSKSGYSSCIYTTGGSGINIKNNILINTQSNTQYSVFINGGTLGQISNNDYYVTNATNKFLNRISKTPYPATGTSVPSNWTSAVTDSNSIIALPSFVSATNFHLQDVAANNNLQGIALSEVTNDIDGDTRVKPYMGADEIPKCAPVGTQTTYGNNSWIGYVYKTTTLPATGSPTDPNPATPTTIPVSSNMTYIGQVEENKLFNRDVVKAAVTGLNPQLCELPEDYFFVRYKMKTTVAVTGTYNITVGGDDYYRLYITSASKTTKVIEQWSGQNYSQQAINIELTAGVDYFFDIEYYEKTTDSRIQFSMGQIAGKNDTYPFGDNLWKVYGFTTAASGKIFTIPQNSYAGYYSVNPVDINTTNSFALLESPSFNPAVSGWQGAPVPQDYFTLAYKRQGFPCGTYQIQITNSDDEVQIFIDDENATTPVYTSSGNINANAPVNSVLTSPRVLGKNSKVEIRLKEYKGTARLNLNFIKVETEYNGSSTPNGSSLVINADTELKADLTVCSCTINDKKTLTVPKDITLTVDEDIKVLGEGKLLIQNGGSLLQNSTSKNMFTGSITAFEIQRTTKINRYDLTYWSSPITSAKEGGFKLKDLSPATLLDKYFTFTPDGGWATDMNGESEMKASYGYSIRGPQTFDTQIPADFTGKFVGTPNNGNFVIPTKADQYHLIGNPYPSAIDGQKFISDNGDVGPLYFWTHVSPPKRENGSNTATYSSPDYAVLTLFGSTRATTGGETPSGYIGVGQGFFVKPKVTSLTFNNDQRVKAQNTQFFKTTAKETGIEVNRLWLNLSNSEDAFKQLLIGYAEGATNTFDYNYDAITLSGNSYVDFYTISEEKKLSIQARALPFDNTEIIPLGYKAVVASSFTISIDHADGFFNQQAVYLEDKTTGTVTDLRASNYTFTTSVGTFTDRFVLRYTNKSLGTDDFENVADGVLVAVKSKVVNITSGTENIKEVQIYTIGGQTLYNKNKIEAKELQISNLHSSNQVLLVKVILENGHETTKKIIFN